ncbi:MAG: hypothetical protein WCF17_05905 [Terracidiphilus sp.]
MHILMRAAMAGGLCVCTAMSAYSQMGPNHHQKTAGYQDDQGVFHAANQAVPDTVSRTNYTGTLKVKITIDAKTTFKTGTIISCGMNATVESYSLASPGSILLYDDWAYVEATGSGSSYTCSLTLPYSWDAVTAGAETENSMEVEYEVFALNPSGIFSTGNGYRWAEGPVVAGSAIPAIGATTSYAVNVTF